MSTKKATDDGRRRARHECRRCDSLGRIVCHGFTHFECEKCGEGSHHPNTATPKICHKCCKKLKICCRCGRDMDAPSPFDHLYSTSEVVLAVGIASSPHHIVLLLRDTATVKSTTDAIRGKPWMRRKLVEFVKELADEPCDEKYMHHNSSAICAGLVVLGSSRTKTTTRLLKQMAGLKSPSMWAPREVAVLLMEGLV
jgi:hypothetical protein